MTLKLEIDTNNLKADLNEFAASLEEVTGPGVLDAISRAVFSITGQRFMIAIDNYSRKNPKKMHHVYEWGKVGNKTKRLFVLERSIMINGNLVITTNFLPSKLPVPINKELLKPGSTGKVVSKKSIFANKAKVMEAGTPVSFTAKRVLSIVGNNGIAFIAPGTKINILHPGGLQTKNSFASYIIEWYTKNAGLIMDSSGLYQMIGDEVSKVMNSNNYGVSEVRLAVENVVEKFDKGVIIK
jgi:hypothetical protein